MQSDEENFPENNVTVPAPEVTSTPESSMGPTMSTPSMGSTPPPAPIVNDYSQPPVAPPPVTFQPPVIDEPAQQMIPPVIEQPKPAGFMDKVKSFFSK